MSGWHRGFAKTLIPLLCVCSVVMKLRRVGVGVAKSGLAKPRLANERMFLLAPM